MYRVWYKIIPSKYKDMKVYRCTINIIKRKKLHRRNVFKRNITVQFCELRKTMPLNYDNLMCLWDDAILNEDVKISVLVQKY